MDTIDNRFLDTESLYISEWDALEKELTEDAKDMTLGLKSLSHSKLVAMSAFRLCRAEAFELITSMREYMPFDVWLVQVSDLTLALRNIVTTAKDEHAQFEKAQKILSKTEEAVSHLDRKHYSDAHIEAIYEAAMYGTEI